MRSTMRHKRDALTPDFRERAALAVSETLAHFEPWKSASVIASYMPLRSEFNAVPLVQHALDQGVQVVYPRVNGKLLDFHFWRPGDPLEPSIGGVDQPLATSPQLNIDRIDLFLTPLLACGDQGIRLGYGGGFYDRLFAHARGFKLGLGFAVQRVARWQTEPHDQRLDGFVSEEGVERF